MPKSTLELIIGFAVCFSHAPKGGDPHHLCNRRQILPQATLHLRAHRHAGCHQANRTVGKGALLNKELLAEIGKEHKNLLRDIAGYIKAMKEGAELNKSNGLKIEPVDFFLESTYPDSKGEIRPCYLLTKKGCDMVANKLTGQKGVLFTAAYVTAFEQMRERIKTGKALPDDESRKLRARAMALNAANRSARMLIDAYDSAGIQPSYKVLALTDLYRNEGLKLPTPPLEVDELTYDFTEMAEALGILSEASGKPHAQAVGAIVSTLAIPEQMIVHAPMTATATQQTTTATRPRCSTWCAIGSQSTATLARSRRRVRSIG